MATIITIPPPNPQFQVQYVQSSRFQAIGILTKDAYRSGGWRSPNTHLVGAGAESQTLPVGQLRQIGAWSIGVDTCSGVAFVAVDAARQLNAYGLVHLSPDVVLNQNGCNCPEALFEIFGFVLNRLPGQVTQVTMSHWIHGGNFAAKEAVIEDVLSVAYKIPANRIFAVRDGDNNPSSIAVNALGQSGILVGFP